MHIPASHGQLEALLKEPAGAARGAVVVCHPHPLHGGTMHTKAVYRAAQAFNDAGLVALRFNFRGVGTSTGSHDEGVGERDDLRETLDWLEAEYPDLPLLVGGFSFGSMVGLSVGADDERVVALLGLGLPVDMDRYDYSFLAEAKKPILVVQGENDEFGAGDTVAALLSELGAHITLVRIPGTDHYFTDRLDELRATIRCYYESGPGSRTLAIV
ncbi:MAG TPA: alpha/beta fold hydrolase [Gemmatimonadetes bacterium]|nr:alpha/beta fold hydrolase [Gemmatimonadota bacterium]